MINRGEENAQKHLIDFILFFFRYYQWMIDVLSINSIVYLVDDVVGLMYNEGNKRKFGQKKQKQANTDSQRRRRSIDFYLRFNEFS